MRTRKIESQAPLTKPLVVLRQVNFDQLSEASVEMLAQTNVNYLLTEGELLWFQDGYILNDMPRASELVREIIAATVGFAVARTDNGVIAARFGPDGLRAAEKAAASARMVVSTEIEIEDDLEEALAPEAVSAK